MEHLLVVRPDGTVEFIYADPLAPVLDAGDFNVRRASNVEPTQDGRWQADMAPVGGPVLPPTGTRCAALALEVQWLEAHVLLHQRIDLGQRRESNSHLGSSRSGE